MARNGLAGFQKPGAAGTLRPMPGGPGGSDVHVAADVLEVVLLPISDWEDVREGGLDGLHQGCVPNQQSVIDEVCPESQASCCRGRPAEFSAT